jgi:hypoxanthine-guanine phosphoribosyltransferase
MIYSLFTIIGSSIFFHDLLRAISKQLESKHFFLSVFYFEAMFCFLEKSIELDYDFIRVSSYQNTQSTGQVSISGLSSLENLREKHLLVVEDIVDTGKTMMK